MGNGIQIGTTQLKELQISVSKLSFLFECWSLGVFHTEVMGKQGSGWRRV